MQNQWYNHLMKKLVRPESDEHLFSDDYENARGVGKGSRQLRASSSGFFALWDFIADVLRVGASLVSTERYTCSDYSVHLRVDIRCTNYALLAGWSFRRFPFRSSVSTVPGGGLAFSRVLSDDSEFMIACREGRLFEVQDLYRQGGGRPDDVSELNMTPLLVCLSISCTNIQ